MNSIRPRSGTPADVRIRRPDSWAICHSLLGEKQQLGRTGLLGEGHDCVELADGVLVDYDVQAERRDGRDGRNLRLEGVKRPPAETLVGSTKTVHRDTNEIDAPPEGGCQLGIHSVAMRHKDHGHVCTRGHLRADPREVWSAVGSPPPKPTPSAPAPSSSSTHNRTLSASRRPGTFGA